MAKQPSDTQPIRRSQTGRCIDTTAAPEVAGRAEVMRRRAEEKPKPTITPQAPAKA
ncbi:MAG TPA: hypothetical protein VNR18_09685 [Hyphomicrobiales bacterium]|nr:hypothetical protein [Hyphomicrobiales bacterium]